MNTDRFFSKKYLNVNYEFCYLNPFDLKSTNFLYKILIYQVKNIIEKQNWQKRMKKKKVCPFTLSYLVFLHLLFS